MQEGVRCEKFAELAKTFFYTADTSVTAVPWVYQFYLVTLLSFVCFFALFLSCFLDFFLTCLLACSFFSSLVHSRPCMQHCKCPPCSLYCYVKYQTVLSGRGSCPVSQSLCYFISQEGTKYQCQASLGPMLDRVSGGPPYSARSQCSIRTAMFDSSYATQPDPSGPNALSYVAKALNHPSSSSELLG